ncbi:hypothetical protein B0H13DRAFT_2681038 [Mycena leptocephala]|nr:hypothetical protein B0H13DRAFT_2681038 [Mycena leptocephala]
MTVPNLAAWMIAGLRAGCLVRRSNTATSALRSHHHSAAEQQVLFLLINSAIDARSNLVRCARLFCFESSRRAGRACSLSLPSLPRLVTRRRERCHPARRLSVCKYGSLVNLDLHTALGSQNARLAHGRAQTRGGEERKEGEECGQGRGREPLRESDITCSTRHYPLTRVLPFLQVSFAGGSSLFTFPPPLLIRPIHPHLPPGYNHSVNFLDGVMGYANGRYMLDYIRVLVEFISQHEYKDLIPMFGIVNEAYLPGIRRYVLTSFTQHDPRWTLIFFF